MRINLGSADKTIRIVVGIALLSVPFWVAGPASWLGLIGMVPLVTGLYGYCPLYELLGFDTCPIEKKTV